MPAYLTASLTCLSIYLQLGLMLTKKSIFETDTHCAVFSTHEAVEKKRLFLSSEPL